MRRALIGGIAGLVATGLMTALMAVGKAAGLLGKAPPKTITGRLEKRVGMKPKSQSAFRLTWLASHVAYGTSFGVVYAFARRFLPGGVVGGLLFGVALWAISYVGVLPALGLYPAPDEDSISREAVMIGAHLVYGATLAEVEARL